MNGSEITLSVAGVMIGLQAIQLIRSIMVKPDVTNINTKIDAVHRRLDEMRDTLIVMPCRDHSERLAYIEGKLNGKKRGKQ